jgi:UDP-N-acetylmuramoylalanine--D-glutamate ligase
MTTYAFPSLRREGLTMILGLGETGVAAGAWCARHGASLRVVDTRSEPAGLSALQDLLGEITIDQRFGPDALSASALDDVHTIVLSPGLAPHEEPVAGLLAMAAERDIEVIGEIELFARALADMAAEGYSPKVLAVTGTNGKTTVTVMTRQLVQASGMSAASAGNISPAALTALMQALDANQLPEVWILELSSFQLETLSSLSADAAVILNVTQDHLDWHGDMQSYAKAKARLFQLARNVVVNRDDPWVQGMVQRLDAPQVRSFGKDAPELDGDLGLESSAGVVWLTASEAMDFDIPVSTGRRKKEQAELVRHPGRLTRLMPADAIRVRGTHNALNALAALALGRSLDLGWAAMLRALRDYTGEPHRMEFVRTVADIEFVNDSKGTNVGATVAALEGSTQKVVLIAGGLGKGQDFSLMTRAVRDAARAVVLIGQDAELIARALQPAGVSLTRADSMAHAVRQAFDLAQPGDIVLLSPACASMDMFKNYPHRGQVFRDEVRELALDRGEIE